MEGRVVLNRRRQWLLQEFGYLNDRLEAVVWKLTEIDKELAADEQDGAG